MSRTATQESAHLSSPEVTLRTYLILVGIGAFVTTFTQQRVLGNYPTLFLLKDHLHFSKEQVSEFFLWATFAWNLKPLAGVLTDAFPVFGYRRRLYMLFGAVVAGLSWLALTASTNDYSLFLTFSILLNIGMVFTSTSVGGLQVEAGHTYSIPGRITALRQIVASISYIAGPLLGGWLAAKAFGWTSGFSAAVLLGLAVYVFTSYQEHKVAPPQPVSDELLARPVYQPPVTIMVGILAIGAAATWCVMNAGFANIGYSLYALLVMVFLVLALAMTKVRNPVLHKAQGQLSQILQSRTLWLAAFMLFLAYTVPGLATALTYRQSDELKFSESFIGQLSSIEGGASLVFAFIYAAICSKFNLRTLLMGAILGNAAATLLFLYYSQDTAILVHGLTGAMTSMSELALMDLAVRSTPRGCEALGFSLMMSIRNFGISLSDVLGSKLMDQFHFSFDRLVWVNAGITVLILLFIPLLPKIVMLKKEGEQIHE